MNPSGPEFGLPCRGLCTGTLVVALGLAVFIRVADGGKIPPVVVMGRIPPRIVPVPGTQVQAGSAYEYDAQGGPAAHGDQPIMWSLGKMVSATSF